MTARVAAPAFALFAATAALLLAIVTSAAAQQPARKNQLDFARPDFSKRDPGKRELGRRNAQAVERAAPCREHGPGFKPGPGGSCIRIFGGVITEMGTSGSRR